MIVRDQGDGILDQITIAQMAFDSAKRDTLAFDFDHPIGPSAKCETAGILVDFGEIFGLIPVIPGDMFGADTKTSGIVFAGINTG